MRIDFITGIILSAIVLDGCYWKEVAVEECDLGSVEISRSSAGTRIKLRLKEEVSEEDVIAPGLFADFWPSITHSEAVEKFGEPLFIRRTGEGVFYYYQTQRGVVEIAHEETRSWGVAIVWKLRAYPNDQDADVILNQEIAKYINVSDEYLNFTVLNPDGPPGKEIIAKNGEVLYVIWINQRGSSVESAKKASVVSEGVDF